ncbi:MAG TPA: hypothetical protein VED40_02390 [Azospirillaceae bacterium]|nr:hypothetical protein [Azospirillaceae bacterium]
MTEQRKDNPLDASGTRTERVETPPVVIPEQDLRRKAHAPQGGATGSGGGAPVERTAAENLKEAGIATDAPVARATGGSGIDSGLQPGGTTPAAGNRGGLGSIGSEGATGPAGGNADAGAPPRDK